jgi:hypothetical protein
VLPLNQCRYDSLMAPTGGQHQRLAVAPISFGHGRRSGAARVDPERWYAGISHRPSLIAYGGTIRGGGA